MSKKQTQNKFRHSQLIIIESCSIMLC